ncbi:MAG TPA: hypothetical protein GX731_09095 [Clostridiales bacterium]|nr:hypothetical protein [Clostridiales bacterium]
MLKKINSIFFGLFFLIALILEIFVIYKFDGDLFTTIGIGLVVLITGYIFMDTVRSQVQESISNIKLDLEKSQKEELDIIKKELKQLLDIQKASYTATKKNAFMLKKTMEGQKNALNLELNHNKESTRQLIEVFKIENIKIEQHQEELKKILARLEDKKPSETNDSNNSNQKFSEDNKEVIEPLYDDPNKALTADEITSLFEAYGK